MKKTINIPQTLVVGYNERGDTYSGKLAYVVYVRNKKKDGEEEIAKECSWRGWIKPELGIDRFDNIPTEGFVLNKKVGDYNYGWWGEQRRAKIRVYDPRGFEVEITPDNLLWILECCSSIKGKGLEGEFVYGWDGKDLLLVPCASSDYIESKKLIEKRETKTVKAADLIVGNKYTLASNGETIVYIGKKRLYEELHSWSKKSQLIDGKYQGVDTVVERRAYVYCKDKGNAWWFLDKDLQLFHVTSVPSKVIDDGLGLAEPHIIADGIKKLNSSIDAKCRDYKNDRLELMTYDEFADIFYSKLLKYYYYSQEDTFYVLEDMNCDGYYIKVNRDGWPDGKPTEKTESLNERRYSIEKYVYTGDGVFRRRVTSSKTMCLTARDIYDRIRPAWRCFAYTDGTIKKCV